MNMPDKKTISLRQLSGGIVLSVSFSMMLLEILSSRLLAPFVGNSLYTWTSVIGLILAAYAIGSYLGGRIAGRYSSWRILIATLLIAGLSLILSLLLLQTVGPSIRALDWSVQVKALLAVSCLCVIPTVLLSAIYPQLLKLETTSLQVVGRTIGSIGAWNAAGSIVGTLIGGFFLTQYLSAFIVMYFMSAMLIVSALLVAFISPKSTNIINASKSDLATPLNEKLNFIPVRLFITGFCLMALQIISGRIMAPYLGVSIYAWTSVIIATLVGIIAGYQVGGQIADQQLSREKMASTFIMAGSTFLLSIVLGVLLGELSHFIPMHIAVKTIWYAMIVFMPPAFFLSATTPMLMRFGMSSVTKASGQYGTFMAWSSLGNLLGIFLTGFVLINVIGTRWLMVIMALICFALSLTTKFIKTKRAWSVFFPALGFFIIILSFPPRCLVESNYYCIQINTEQQTSKDGKQHTVKTLRLDHLIHSFVDADHPDHLGYGYEQAYATLIAYKYKPQDTFTTMFVGGGGYVLPRYLEAFYPSSTNMVAEIDPAVTKINHDVLGLKADTRIQTINQDARQALDHVSKDKPLDLVFADAFNDFSVPFHLTTVEFHRELKTHMSKNGVYALNVIDDARYGNFLSAMIKTLQQVWTHVAVISGSKEIGTRRNTFVLIASDAPIDPTIWSQTHTFADDDSSDKTMLAPDKVQAFLDAHPVQVLRDELVPTDRYLAPVFRDEY